MLNESNNKSFLKITSISAFAALFIVAYCACELALDSSGYFASKVASSFEFHKGQPQSIHRLSGTI